MKMYIKIFLTLLLTIILNDATCQVVIEVDTTVFAYGLDDDTSMTENGLVRNLTIQFELDSMGVDQDSLRYGTFDISFEVKSTTDLGNVHLELSRFMGGQEMPWQLMIYSPETMLESGLLVSDSIHIQIELACNPGAYGVYLLVFTKEGSALRVLTKTIIL